MVSWQSGEIPDRQGRKHSSREGRDLSCLGIGTARASKAEDMRAQLVNFIAIASWYLKQQDQGTIGALGNELAMLATGALMLMHVINGYSRKGVENESRESACPGQEESIEADRG